MTVIELSVEDWFPFAPEVVRTAISDPVLLSGWLAEDASAALEAAMDVEFDAVPADGGTALTVTGESESDDLARARFQRTWRRRFEDLGQLLRGRPVDWANR